MQNYLKRGHTTYHCKYHIVWITKYRKKVLFGVVAERVRELLRDICKEHEVEIMKGHVSKDHLHLFICVPPHFAISKLVQYLKGKSSYKLLSENAVVENHNGLTTRWAEAYTKNLVEALQKAINHVKHYQIHQFTLTKLDGNTRIKAFPQLLLNQRKLEQYTFDFQNVLQLLSRYNLKRIVDITGCISLFHQKLASVGLGLRKTLAYHLIQ
ncbi:MAG: IS200/IS605 family transposase [Spirosomaceae bacterium]|jgi:putative transposase|nr:IS200/IS605 family transposase [Spirosomataceae bacterium]